MTRQRLAQLRNEAKGMCSHHKDRPVFNGSTLCKDCHKKKRECHNTQRGFYRSHKQTRELIDSLDWSKSDEALAKQTNLGVQSIRKYRRGFDSKALPIKITTQISEKLQEAGYNEAAAYLMTLV